MFDSVFLGVCDNIIHDQGTFFKIIVCAASDNAYVLCLYSWRCGDHSWISCSSRGWCRNISVILRKLNCHEYCNANLKVDLSFARTSLHDIE